MNDGSYLMHHGTKGMKWGVRRYQNPDGSLTPEGKKRYGFDKSKFRSSDNVKEAGRRSALASAKASVKGNVGRSAALTAAGTALGVAGVGGISVGALPLVGIAAGATFVADMALNASIGAVMGWQYGRDAARQQNREIQNKVKNGESFVLEELTAVSTSKSTLYGNHIKTEIHRKAMDGGDSKQPNKKMAED